MTEGPLTWPFYPACDMGALGLSPEQQTQVIAVAVEWLWANSGRQFGTRAVVYRPQAIAPARSQLVPSFLQPVSGSPWGYGYGNLSSDECDPARAFVLELPEPAVSVEQVQIGAVVVDPQVYRLDGKWLVRQDQQPWPTTQNLISPLGAENTWAVSYTRGLLPDPFGQYACGKLICKVANDVKSGKPCAVPFNATMVSRAGVTVQRDITKALKTTGVSEADQWVALVNPVGLQSNPAVWSPDLPRNRWAFAGSLTTQEQGFTGFAVDASFLVLGPTDPVPDGTPVGTLIFRTE